MQIPIMRGTIDRRILVNYRVAPEALARILPPPFQPQVINGYGIAGICLIRLKSVRPRHFPAPLGIASENAAHRIAVEWDLPSGRRVGVYIPRRDTSSRINALVGGKLFPGLHHRARFLTDEQDGRYSVQLDSFDDETHVRVAGRITDDLPASSIFASMREASVFFQGGSLGYSATSHSGEFDGLELKTFDWHIEPLQTDHVESSYFDDRRVFPLGSVAFDSAFLMRNINHEWLGRPSYPPKLTQRWTETPRSDLAK